MVKKDRRKVIKTKVEKEVMVDELGLEDTQSFKGALFNRPLTSVGFFLFILGPIVAVYNGFFGGFIWIVGCVIAAYGSGKRL